MTVVGRGRFNLYKCWEASCAITLKRTQAKMYGWKKREAHTVSPTLTGHNSTAAFRESERARERERAGEAQTDRKEEIEKRKDTGAIGRREKHGYMAHQAPASICLSTPGTNPNYPL